MKFLALIQGGEGPDVWDREMEIDACDFIDAAKQAHAEAEEMGGQVVDLSRQPTTISPNEVTQ